jgi:hypothetical protein
MSRLVCRLVLPAALLVSAGPSAAQPPEAQPSSPLSQLGQIKAPTIDAAREQSLTFLSASPQGAARLATALPLWDRSLGRTLLDRTIDTYVLADDFIAQFVKSVRAHPSAAQLETPVLKDEKIPGHVRQNLKLFLARGLAHRRLHEDALALLRSLTPETLVDPATYYFYRAVCENKLRLKDDGLLSIHRLLTSMQQDAPERYLVVAAMMQDEMQKWEEQDLGDVARRMEEIEARLHNARGGAKTQEKQKEVVALLDKLIKDLEDQCCQGGSSGAGSARSQTPASDSKIMNGTGPGEVENKKLINTAEIWGKMPEKEKVKALEAVNRQLPAHIREAAEGFSKKLQSGGKP